jgi:hypothetical protein
VPNLIVDPERYVSRGSNAQSPFERSDGDCALELSCVESLRFNSWAMNTTASEGQSRYREACLDPRPYYEAPSITDQIVRTAKLAALTL